MIYTVIFGILALLCLTYYIIMVSYAGVHTAFGSVWLLSVVFFAVVCVLTFFMHKKGIKLPGVVKVVCGMVVILGLVVFIAVEGLVVSGMLGKPRENLDYIIVLGAQVRGTKITNSLEKRLETAKTYLDNNMGTVAVVSGGQGEGEDLSEAQCMKNYLLEHGVAEDRIIMESRSINTNQNIEFSMGIIQSLSDKTNPQIGIITNNFHVYRTVAVCRKKGYDVCGISAESDKILFLNYMVREFFALVKYKLTGLI